MMNKHFFKTLLLFAGMILLGFVGISLVSYFDEKQKEASKEAGKGAEKGVVDVKVAD